MELEKASKLLFVQQAAVDDQVLLNSKLKQQLVQVQDDNKRKLIAAEERASTSLARIQLLEQQLRDIAYGSQPRKTSFIAPSLKPGSDVGRIINALPALEGQNIFELTVIRAILSEHALVSIGVPHPRTFITFDVFQQSTQVFHALPPCVLLLSI